MHVDHTQTTTRSVDNLQLSTLRPGESASVTTRRRASADTVTHTIRWDPDTSVLKGGTARNVQIETPDNTLPLSSLEGHAHLGNLLQVNRTMFSFEDGGDTPTVVTTVIEITVTRLVEEMV